jgi:hypothetical protein
MLRRVRDLRPSYNNNQRIASSQSVSALKLVYYRFLGFLYSLTGFCVDMAFVNSSWTEQHMKEMWSSSLKCSGVSSLIKLFPPCNTLHLHDIPLGLTSDLGVFREDLKITRSTFNINSTDDSIGRGTYCLLVNFGPKRIIHCNFCKTNHPIFLLMCIHRSFSRFLKDNPEER